MVKRILFWHSYKQDLVYFYYWRYTYDVLCINIIVIQAFTYIYVYICTFVYGRNNSTIEQQKNTYVCTTYSATPNFFHSEICYNR